MKLLVLLCCLLLWASSVSAQAEIATDVRKGFEEVNDWVTKAADMVPADKYSYRPVDTVRTFGELIAISPTRTIISARTRWGTKLNG
jgi:hypothetical protein